MIYSSFSTSCIVRKYNFYQHIVFVSKRAKQRDGSYTLLCLNMCFTEKCHNNIKSKHYIRPKSDANCFAIHHFAGRVVYQAENFLEKNRNFLPTEVIQLIRSSKFELVRYLFQCPITKTGNLYSAIPEEPASSQPTVNFSISSHDAKDRFSLRGLASQSRAQQTVATYFRFSLMDLLQKMVAGMPQFVRCIKPNEYQASKQFDTAKVLRQLRCAGVLETIRIRQHGFSHRLTFGDFMKRYCFLAFSFIEKVSASRESCRMLLVRLKMDGWALGKSKVFLKYYHVEFLAKRYEEHLRKIVLVQACVRGWLARVEYKRKRLHMVKSALTLQKHVRGWLTRKRVSHIRNEWLQQQKQQQQQRLREQEQLKQLQKNRRQQMNKNYERESFEEALCFFLSLMLWF